MKKREEKGNSMVISNEDSPSRSKMRTCLSRRRSINQIPKLATTPARPAPSPTS